MMPPIIPQNLKQTQPECWQQQWSNAFTTLDDLLTYLCLDRQQLYPDQNANQQTQAAIQAFNIRVPKKFADKIAKGDPKDPLLLQILPQPQEQWVTPGYSKDALAELSQNPHKSFIHKYHGRILLIMTGACPVHCRYCFRRHFPYNEYQPSREDWQQASTYLKQHPDITELILSGGDPLSYNTRSLYRINELLADNPQIKRLRIHTRFPVILPSRIDEPLLQWLGSLPTKVIMVLHCNHASELDTAFKQAMQKLIAQGVHLFNQSVLLKGINDDSKTLVALSHKLFDYHVLPYYLHLNDQVEGTQHFAVSLKHAVILLQKISGQLPGYLVPKLATEVPGFNSKLVTGPYSISTILNKRENAVDPNCQQLP